MLGKSAPLAVSRRRFAVLPELLWGVFRLADLGIAGVGVDEGRRLRQLDFPARRVARVSEGVGVRFEG